MRAFVPTQHNDFDAFVLQGPARGARQALDARIVGRRGRAFEVTPKAAQWTPSFQAGLQRLRRDALGGALPGVVKRRQRIGARWPDHDKISARARGVDARGVLR
ncbi:MAG: hypothetical protein ACOYJ6_18995 [Caulobacterales bacterium]